MKLVKNLPENVNFLVNLFYNVQTVGVDVILRDVDDLDCVGHAGLLAHAPLIKNLKNYFLVLA